MPVSNLLTWDAFAKEVHDPFEFILHDIGPGWEDRPAKLAPVLAQLVRAISSFWTTCTCLAISDMAAGFCRIVDSRSMFACAHA